MNITPTLIRIIEADIAKALETVAEKHGVKIANNGGGSYNSTSFTMKLNVTSPEGDERKKKMANMNAVMIGLPENVIGKLFSMRGTVYKITNINLNRPKYPISVVRMKDNRGFKFDLETVKGLLK